MIIGEGAREGPVITIDIDWAPDFVIEAVASALLDANVRATWFVTHASPAIEELRRRSDLFELGIHPNFLPGSSHGDTPTEVIKHCMELVPEARAMRTHSLAQSTGILQTVAELSPVNIDVSLFLPGSRALTPVRQYFPNGTELVRIPYNWEDDHEMCVPVPRWELDVFPAPRAPSVVNFHPLHVFMNSSSTEAYDQLRKVESNVGAWTKGLVAPQVSESPGAGSLFSALVASLREEPTLRISDLVSDT